MTKAIAVAVLSAFLSFLQESRLPRGCHDWHTAENVHNHVLEAIHEMETSPSAAANHYDMAGNTVPSRRGPAKSRAMNCTTPSTRQPGRHAKCRSCSLSAISHQPSAVRGTSAGG